MTTPALPNEFDVHEGHRLGWTGPTKKTVLAFDRFLTGVIPPNPPTADFMSKVGTWNGETNKRFGTCGPCSVSNLFIASFQYHLGEQVSVSDDNVFDLYRRSGNPSFDPRTGNGDNGVDTAVMLNEVRAGDGITITRSDGTDEVHHIVAFGKLTGQGPALVQQMETATALFGGAILGVMLEIAQQQQTVNKPPVWHDVAGSPDWGGHDIFGGRYISQRYNNEQAISWLVPVGIGNGFIRNRAMEIFVAITDIAIQHAPLVDGVDWNELAQAFQQLTGDTLDLSQLGAQS